MINVENINICNLTFLNCLRHYRMIRVLTWLKFITRSLYTNIIFSNNCNIARKYAVNKYMNNFVFIINKMH